MNGRLLCLFLVSIVPFYVIAQEEEDVSEEEVEFVTTHSITESEIEFINKSIIDSKIDKSVTNSGFVTEMTTTDDSMEYEDSEDKPNLIDELLIRGPDVEQLSRNSTPETVYLYLSTLLGNEMQAEYDKFKRQIHQYFFILQELVSDKCFLGLTRLASRVENGDSRAFNILDASSKILINGLSSATFTDLGNFDQCLINYEPPTEDDKPLNGRYCLIKVRPPLPLSRPGLRYTDKILNFRNSSLENKVIDQVMSSAVSLYSNPFTFGICFPADCEGQEIQIILNQSMHRYDVGLEVGNDCYTGDSPSLLSIGDIIPLMKRLDLLVIGMMCAIVVLATVCEFIYDLLYERTLDSQKPVILYFSLISNAKNLYSSKTINESNKGLQSINGLRLMAILWTVVSNVYLLGYQPQIRPFIKNVGLEMERRGGCPAFQLILNSWLSSQIFFFIGGLLMAFTMTRQLATSSSNTNIIKYLVKRFTRLIPPLVFPTLLVFLMPVLPNGGPVYNSSTEQLKEVCIKKWWTNFLLISNWFDPSAVCLPHLWFVSALFQLQVVGIILLVVFRKNIRLLHVFSMFMILIGVVSPMVATYHFSLSAKSPIMDKPLLHEIPNEIKMSQMWTFNHISVFFIGLLFGVHLNSQQTKYSIGMFRRLILWLVLPLTSLVSIIISFAWNDVRSQPSLQLSIVYNGIHRIAFISGIVWIAFECVHGKAGLIGRALSAKLLVPLSRLTFQIYLLNIIIVWLYFFTKRDLIIYRDMELLFITSGVFFWTLMLSIFAYLVFEVPFARISKRFFTEEENARNSSETLVMKSGNDVAIDVDKSAVIGNGINGLKSRPNDESGDTRL